MVRKVVAHVHDDLERWTVQFLSRVGTTMQPDLLKQSGFIRFDRIHERDEHADRRTQEHRMTT